MADGKVSIAVEWGDALVTHRDACGFAVRLTVGHAEAIACMHPSLPETLGRAVRASWSIVGYHERYVIPLRLFFPSMPIHASGIEEALLIRILVVADFASTYSSLPACPLAYGDSVLLIVATFMPLMHE